MRLLLCLNVIGILAFVAGAMATWGISLNALSLVNLVITVGLGIEFSVHLARAFVLEKGTIDDASKRRFWRCCQFCDSRHLDDKTMWNFCACFCRL